MTPANLTAVERMLDGAAGADTVEMPVDVARELVAETKAYHRSLHLLDLRLEAMAPAEDASPRGAPFDEHLDNVTVWEG